MQQGEQQPLPLWVKVIWVICTLALVYRMFAASEWL